VQEITLDPDELTADRTVFITSPNYPSKYPNDQECKWIITATSGKLNLVFDKFNIQATSTCNKDYLKVSGPIKKYTKATLCGAKIPSDFNLTSKKQTMVLKFVSDGSTRKTGFRAYIVATG